MFAIVGTAGNVILFVCVGVLFVILAGYGVALAARVYTVVVQGTAAGQDEVRWPDEPLFDWLPQSFHLLGLLAVWVIPAGLLARWLQPVFLPDDTPLRSTILIGLAVWLLFPVGALSMQKAGAIIRLIQNPLTMLGFYLLTGVLMAAVCAGLYFALFSVAWPVVPVAAVMGSAAVLIHARLVGRLGYMIGQAMENTPGPRKVRKARRIRGNVTDPWAAPEQEEPLPAPAGGYAVVELATEEPARKRSPSEEDVPDPYEVSEPHGEPLPSQPPVSELRKHEIEREVALRTRALPEPPASLLFSSVWSFPFKECSHRALGYLSFWALGTLCVARLLVTLWPF